MAEPKKIKTRIINKHAQAAAWESVKDTFKPLEGELIVYDKDNSESVPRIKIGNGTNTVGALPFIQSGIVDNASIICDNDTGKLSLAARYIEYLDNQLYQAPSITTFNIVGNNQEVSNTSYSVSSFSHAESNVSNINGNLTLTRGSTEIANNIVPSGSSTSITIEDSFTPNTAQTVTYTLSGYNTKDARFTKTDSISFYFPSFIGASENDTISDESGLTKVASGSLAGTRSVVATNHYVYFVTTTAISSIKSGGFDVSYSQQDNVNLIINGVTKSYYVYRTNEIITSELEYVIK